MMRSVLVHGRDFDQYSFQEGQSSLLSQSAFKRFDESPKPNHDNRDLDGIASQNAVREAANSRKIMRDQKIVGKITVKTRDAGNLMQNNKNRKVVQKPKSLNEEQETLP